MNIIITDINWQSIQGVAISGATGQYLPEVSYKVKIGEMWLKGTIYLDLVTKEKIENIIKSIIEKQLQNAE